MQSIAVWQPFLLQTLRTTDGSTNLLFDSSNIELEVVDMVLVGNDVLKREKGEDFAKAVAKTFYSLCELIQTEKYQKDIVVNIGKKFCNLNYDDMKIVLNKCVFFDTPEAGGVFYKEEWKDKMSNIVVPTSIKIGLIKKEDTPTIGFGDPSKDLNFTMEYLRR